METLLQDLRYAIRMLIRKPGFTVVAILALALGIGANSAIFSVVNAALLRPLPYKNPDRIVMVWNTNPEVQIGFDHLPVTVADYVDWRDQSESFQSISIINSGRLALTGFDTPDRVAGALVSASFFDVMGASPAIGRAFTVEEDKPGADRVAVISHAMWRKQFAGSPGALGKTLTLEGNTYTVIGVMPEGFHFPRAQDLPSYFQLAPQTELWLPIALTDEQLKNRDSHNKAVIGRLKPDVTPRQAQSEMEGIAARLGELHEEAKGFSVAIVSLQEQLVGHARTALWVLLGAVGFVLLIACANIANLLLARSASRQKEMAIRTALGASRARIIRQLFTESIVLSIAGGAVGIVLALWGLDVILALSHDYIPRKHEIGIDLWALGFTFLISILTGVLFGLAPAIQASRINLNETLKEGARGTSGASGTRIRSFLIVFEMAMTLVLLIGAGLMLRSFVALMKTDPGFNSQNVITMQVEPLETNYPQERLQVAFFKQAIERIRSLPGAESVSGISDLPLSGAEEIDQFTVEGHPVESLNDIPLADFRFADYDYFNTMRIPLIAGRYFTGQDDETSQSVVVINQTLANRFFPGQDPLGKRIKSGDQDSESEWCVIIGVVGDVKHSGFTAEVRPQIYFPYPQAFSGRLTIIARTSSDPNSFVAAMRNEIWAVDKDQPVTNIKTLEEYASASVSKNRFSLVLLGVFAALALVLAAVGIYGVMSYAVAERTHEIGIRMALGAGRGDILKLVIGQGLLLAVVGIAAGTGGALLLTRFMSSLLVGVSATDPFTFIVIPLILTGVALAACFVPARRAMKVDPMVALRYE